MNFNRQDWLDTTWQTRAKKLAIARGIGGSSKLVGKVAASVDINVGRWVDMEVGAYTIPLLATPIFSEK
jgi:hypothetical protein